MSVRLTAPRSTVATEKRITVSAAAALLFLLELLLQLRPARAVILSGAPNSYARYPRWAYSFENRLSLELKTRQANALVLYTDDGGEAGNFYAISIADGRLQLDFRIGRETDDFGRRRTVNTIRVEEVRVDDDRWHSISINQAWENVQLELDHAMVFRILNQNSFVFNARDRGSHVYIGGVPQDLHLLPTMSSPLRRYSQHLAGNVRNLIYRTYPEGVTSPPLVDAFGVRQNDDDYCRGAAGVSAREPFTCLNGGRCYSENDGAKCDCTTSAFEGKQCEAAKPDADLSFSGQEWVGYDVSSLVAGAIRSKRENISLDFKTVHGSAMLFFAGDELNYIHLGIDYGALIATSKFEGSDARMIRMFNSVSSSRYDDDAWHTVILERSLQMHSERISALHMTLTVDGRADEIRQYAPETDWISHAFAFLGGVPKERAFEHAAASAVSRRPFRGCVRRVVYTLSALLLPFVHLSDRGFGHSVIRTGGELTYSCAFPAQPPDVLSFNTAAIGSFVSLPKWNAMSSGTLSFHFRTIDNDGLILYHGNHAGGSDFIAFELIDGHLFLVINLGSGSVRLQTTVHRVSSGDAGWHSVQLERVGRTGHVIIDSIKTDFSTPGVSANLIVDDPVFIGGVPPTDSAYPPDVWSISLGRGFVGCIKNVRFNGITSKIATAFEQQNATGITVGCATPSTSTSTRAAVGGGDHCASAPCQNGGLCENSYVGFRCDCGATAMDGLTCAQTPVGWELNGGEPPALLTLPHTVRTEAENIELRFRTPDSRGTLLDTRCLADSSARLRISLVNGSLSLRLDAAKANYSASWGRGVNDNHVHTARVKRRGEKLLLYIDGRWTSSYELSAPETGGGSDVVLFVDEIALGHPIHESANEPGDAAFRGQIYKAVMNDVDLLDRMRRERGAAGGGGRGAMTTTRDWSKDQRNVKPRSQSLSFPNATGYVVLPALHIKTLVGTFRISFKFQTLIRHALILASADTPGSDAFSIEIHNGRIRYTFRSSTGGEYTVVSPTLPEKRHISDMRWHSVVVLQDHTTLEHHLMVDNTTSTLALPSSRRRRAGVAGDVIIASFPPSLAPPLRLSGAPAFRGCLSALRINDHVVDVLEAATARKDVAKGCPAHKKKPLPKPTALGPIARCSPSACSNRGRCIQQWSSIRCDCSFTAHSGSRCQQAGTTYDFPATPSAVVYEHADGRRPSTKKDLFVLAFKTTSSSGVLLAVQCAATIDFLTVFLDRGTVHVKFNLGARAHHLEIYQKRVDDDRWHVLKAIRSHENMTVGLDAFPPVHYAPAVSAGLVTLNMQWRLLVGAAADARHIDGDDVTSKGRRRKRRFTIPGDEKTPTLYDAFHGSVSGVNFNGVMVLDLLAAGSPQVRAIGDVRQSYIAATTPPPEESVMADVMAESAAAPLIESVGATCISIEEHESCFVDTDTQGFFSPVVVLSSSTASRDRDATASRDRDATRATRRPHVLTTTSASTTTTTGESPPPHPTLHHQHKQHHKQQSHRRPTVLPTDDTVTRPSTVSMPSTTSSVIFLEEVVGVEEGSAALPIFSEGGEFEGSGNLPTPAEPVLALAVTPATSPMGPATKTSTVIPRPYDSVEEALSQNPEYAAELGRDLVPDEKASIWNGAAVVPDELDYQRRPETTEAASETSTITTSSEPATIRSTTSTARSTTSAKPKTTTTAVLSTSTTTRRRITTTTTTTAPFTTSTAYSVALSAASKSPVANVRPTTPMTGGFVPSTAIMRDPSSTDFPRTALISAASIAVIVIIACVVFFVFRCRQNPPPGEHYPMVCNGKSAAAATSGYTPIAPELSPPMPHHNHHHHHHADPAMQPLIAPATRTPQTNGNGYQPLKGANVPASNGNGFARNGNGGGPGTAKKKDFKEWYV